MFSRVLTTIRLGSCRNITRNVFSNRILSSNAPPSTIVTLNPNSHKDNIPTYSVDSIASNSTDQNDIERKLKILKLEVDVLRQEGRKSPNPDLLKQEQWNHLLSLESKSARRKYYSYLWGLEKLKENKKLKKEAKKTEIEDRKAKYYEENANNDHIIYSLQHTTLMLRVYDSTINFWHNNKLTRAMQFGQKLVLDCSYDEHMTKREAINAAKQLMLSFAENRVNNEPFDLHYCNVNFNAPTMEYLKKHIPTMSEPHFPMNTHECSYLDLFPKDQLVYLTPHCNTHLERFDPDSIYIIGAMVDKMNNEPLSLGKAKKLGIKMARLPLDNYLQWGSGSGKSLTINQMINILLDIKNTNNWQYSLRHVPRRKVVDEVVQATKLNRNFVKRATKMKFNFNLLEKPEKTNRMAKVIQNDYGKLSVSSQQKKPSKYLKYFVNSE